MAKKRRREISKPNQKINTVGDNLALKKTRKGFFVSCLGRAINHNEWMDLGGHLCSEASGNQHSENVHGELGLGAVEP